MGPGTGGLGGPDPGASTGRGVLPIPGGIAQRDTQLQWLLEQTLEEEKQTDQKLTQLAEEINPQAQTEGEAGEGSGGEDGEGRRRSKGSRRAA